MKRLKVATIVGTRLEVIKRGESRPTATDTAYW
jgi:hypothetical protein